jgi:hypothetical protein
MQDKLFDIYHPYTINTQYTRNTPYTKGIIPLRIDSSLYVNTRQKPCT